MEIWWRENYTSKWHSYFFLSFFLALPVFGNQIIVSNFAGGLDTLDNPAEIDPSMCQNVLNVNYQPGGNAIFKRDGYGLFQSLPTVSTGPVHGGYHFQQLGGNDVQLWGADVGLSGSVNDASFVQLATGTVAATWQCTDSQGKAYCFDSAGDTPVQTDGTAANTSFQPSIPSGTMATFTPLQLVVAGVSGNTNTIYISQQLAFTNFVVGILPSSSFTEPIASPGSRITHLAYYFGRLFWWKDQSFGYATFTGQNDWQLTIVSNQIGTLDNSDAFWNSSGFDAGTMFSQSQSAQAYSSPGGIFFRGQDNHLYVYDGYYLTRLSRIITPTVTAANRKKANLWAQTSQIDFNNGSIVPSPNLSTVISPGDVIVSSFQTIENSSTQWNSGSTNNDITIYSSSFSVTLGSAPMNDPNFEQSTSGNGTCSVGSFSSNWTQSGAISMSVGQQCGGSCGAVNPDSGLYFAHTSGMGTLNGSVFLERTSDGVGFSTVTVGSGDCGCTTSWSTNILSAGSNIGNTVKLVMYDPSNISWLFSNAFLLKGDIAIRTLCTDGSTTNVLFIDNIQANVSTGVFTSKIYNTGFTSSTYQISQFNYSVFKTTPSYSLLTSTSATGVFSTLLTSSGTNAIGNQFVEYVTTTTSNAYDTSVTFISSITIISRSTGTYYSAVNNAPNLTSWGNFQTDDFQPGISSITYYTRASTNNFTVLSSTPAWVKQTKNTTVTASTGTFMQMRGDFYLSAATETPTLNDFTFNWFEGSASDKAYITYFNDAIWFSVSASSSVSTNNEIFYWDLLNGAWTIYNIAANGFLIENNALYFGSPLNNQIYKFGGVTTDNGAPINSFWRSKSFLGNQTPESSANGQNLSFAATDDLFVQKEFIQADFILGESSTTLSYTYTLDSKTSTVYTMTAFDSSASLIQRNFLLPIGKIGKYYDFQIGDNSSAQKWTMMGHRVIYNNLNWRPVTQ